MEFFAVPGTQSQLLWLGGCEGTPMILSREGDHMCRLVFAAVTLITIHTLCKDLATAEISTPAKVSLVTPQSLDISRAREPRL
jgi:hypothetical protein